MNIIKKERPELFKFYLAYSLIEGEKQEVNEGANENRIKDHNENKDGNENEKNMKIKNRDMNDRSNI